ncbi:uncharacterized protein LOC121890069 [Thunnus maccoyii]|uniref:uncharacterized protein LOC121890069 n=1 Tax=Thunnus maccoyii TaxID=8240 RepID=UPI001C4C404F|nr:uncharacterized protein LOC121890069 [Thunnus maccoyii]XP_042258270.1 uncharacterized protein LOC121890069 [Thunnus maccoyii]
MMNLTLITAFILCSISWISVSLSESHTVEVQSGENVTLQCPKIYEVQATISWFRLVNRTKASCISTMISSETVKYCDGFKDGKFQMSSNISTVSLNIKEVNLSDSGVYFCGFNINGQTFLSVIHLNVEESDATTKLMGVILVILGSLFVLHTTVIIGLVVKNRKLQRANEEKNRQQSENLGSDDLNYAAVTFCQKAKRRAVEPNVVYAATR